MHKCMGQLANGKGGPPAANDDTMTSCHGDSLPMNELHPQMLVADSVL